MSSYLSCLGCRCPFAGIFIEWGDSFEHDVRIGYLSDYPFDFIEGDIDFNFEGEVGHTFPADHQEVGGEPQLSNGEGEQFVDKELGIVEAFAPQLVFHLGFSCLAIGPEGALSAKDFFDSEQGNAAAVGLIEGGADLFG